MSDALFWARAGAFLMLTGVGAGAFGAHALKARLPADLLAVFETGVRYQIYHGLALLALAALCDKIPARAANSAGWCFFAGTIVFSGSLYALSLTGARKLGAITPIGGLLFLVGWLALIVAARAR